MCWHPADEGSAGCHTRTHVRRWCARPYILGLWAAVEETFTYPAAGVLGLRIHGTVAPAGPQTVVYHVFDVNDGLVTRITGYADRAQALDAAFPGVATGRGPEDRWR
ncbi:hypothetical protein [Streptomyces spinosisporus]|uniref:SnoaL-like domain-containing protein n=1 Tax=Streptomyces spinosisporus TaxID=2927582 RepID=A0ABS9XB25_9ACTN|nr:hypothetical protein [Streptomyces spinosisporus]MCI3238837.1 hypothetical protein [Streptomyces spinosisporus]